jgi:hypothetical protein
MSRTIKPHPRNAVTHSHRQMSPTAAGVAVFVSGVMRPEPRLPFAVVAGSEREVTT